MVGCMYHVTPETLGMKVTAASWLLMDLRERYSMCIYTLHIQPAQGVYIHVIAHTFML